MKPVDRVVLVISVIIMAGLAMVVLASAAGGFFPNDFAIGFYAAVLDNKALTVIAGVLVVLVILYLIMLAFKPEREMKKPVSISTELGAVQIAMSAVETVAMRAAKQVRGIRDVQASAYSDEDGIKIAIAAEVYSDCSIPQVCAELEKSLSEAVQAAVGVPVKSVHTAVRSVLEQGKPRL